MIKQKITTALSNVVVEYLESKGIAESVNFTVEVPPKNIDADFATNVAMIIAKKVKISPRVVAQGIINIISKKFSNLIEKADFATAGFINFYVKNNVLYTELKVILKERNKYGSMTANNKKKVLVEFVSANPTGPLHIGHGRGAAIGDSISRILKYLGYNVSKEYYLNDVGNQMLVLANSVEVRYKQLKGEKIELPADYYQGECMVNIAKRLIAEGKSFEEVDFRREAVKDILKTIKEDLKDFAVEFDSWFSEMSIVVVKDKEGKSEVDRACQYLLKKGDAYEKDDVLWLASTKFGDDKDRVLKRSDGRYTYLASDVAYHRSKFKRGFQKLVNFWGADHHGYVARIQACVQMLDFNKENLDIILYQFVSLVRNGRPVVMSTRSGAFIALKSVIDEIGRDACRFFFLLRAPDSQLEFDLELAKKHSNENPVFYVQYVNARCNSILKESKKRDDLNSNDNEKIDFDLLNSKEERTLIKQLAAFCDTLALSEKTMSPHHFTGYLIGLADSYHKFYEKCRVLTNDTALACARLKLTEGVMIIIQTGLGLLGISSPDKM
ncbi:MAG: arginine--tRNA ligase [Endomicrobium sp.]|jgi:arginyl-tRNA synthetase|nr:arginine--tRNA ligase [Endomicrobium sp.]